MRARLRFGAFLALGLGIALGLALLASPHASDAPDGLEKVAIEEGFAAQEQAHPLEDLPTAGYAVEGVDDAGLSTALAGGLGVLVTFAVAGGLLLVVRRTGRRHPTVGAA
jgi:hypothetical protein